MNKPLWIRVLRVNYNNNKVKVDNDLMKRIAKKG